MIRLSQTRNPCAHSTAAHTAQHVMRMRPHVHRRAQTQRRKPIHPDGPEVPKTCPRIARLASLIISRTLRAYTWVSAPSRHTSDVSRVRHKTHHPVWPACGLRVPIRCGPGRSSRLARLCTDWGSRAVERSSGPSSGRRHTRARARQGVLAFATPALRSSDLRRASPTPSTARLMTKTTHGLAAADVSLYKTASRGYHDRSPITSGVSNQQTFCFESTTSPDWTGGGGNPPYTFTRRSGSAPSNPKGPSARELAAGTGYCYV